MTLREVILEPLFSRPFHGLRKEFTRVNPALEVLGYYQSSAIADWCGDVISSPIYRAPTACYREVVLTA